MREIEKLVRVILRPDGFVHIAFRDARAIYATRDGLLELFSNPIEFINEKSYTYEYKDSTSEVNRKRVVLEEVLGLTLATVTSDKQIICDFPELFHYIFNTSDDSSSKPLNMSSLELDAILSDEKSYLLRYYLEFTNHLTSTLTIKYNIKLRNEVQCEIIREMLNTFFSDTLPEKTTIKDLSSQIADATDTVVFNTDDNRNNMVSSTEYARIWGYVPETIRKYIKAGKIKGAIKEKGSYLIDKNEKPQNWDIRTGRKKSKNPQTEHYKRRSKGSAEEVKQHILKLDLFTNAIAPFIHTYEEVDYYTKRNYHEVCWDGQSALIIDVNPDYISSNGIKNRDLMADGRAPHFPERNKDEYVFHVHHIGQNALSPFAIIPEYDHNGKTLSSVFHQGSPNAELHGPEFELQKRQFWRNYIEKYDKADGDYNAIEYLNHRSKRNIDKKK